MKRLNNGEVNLISVIRTVDMVSGFYEVDADSTTDPSRSYTLSVGTHLPSNCQNFATLIVDLTSVSIESGEYLFTVKDNGASPTSTTVSFIAIVEDNDRVEVAGSDVYGDSIRFE